ncbi:patatin-like phospholipase family protein [Bacillus sp. ISL-34]|uniref:patatin-like phospholipase family protein n=1 Tax=Bacillus sp. ISL-34 TaxID=2819121 RepID=UPI001BEB7F56|nr:patatin-like phospholipase family protein [Bacillus sp. ISL-34]MBT2649725.1 patatin-like phospholipase family protein [Bacillus sp. ISL-34]
MSEPKVGLALGSGGARGFAHIGVIKVLQQEGIPIDMIAGSSMGAMVAAFYGAGSDIERLYKLSRAFKRKYYLDFTIPKMGFISGKRTKDLIRVFTYGKKFEELDIPVAVVATDIKTGEKVIFQEGPIAPAVRASISIPGIFIPEKIGNRLLVDGGVVDRVPVSVVKDMGADIIIGVDVAHVKQDMEINSIYDVIMQSLDILQMELVKSREFASDIMIRPRVEKYSSKSFTNVQEIISIGEEAARGKIDQIKQSIVTWKESFEDEP